MGLSRNGDPDTLDPTLAAGFSAVEVLRTICLRLYDFNSHSQVVPELAAALPTISKDGLTYTIPLRRGVKFNDGTPFDAAAVATTLKRDLTMPGSQRASDLTPVQSARARGRYVVVIRLLTPFSPLIPTLASNDGIIVSTAQTHKLGSSFGTDPVCVGPFMFSNRVVGDSVTVVKSPYFYDRAKVHLDKVVFKPATDATAAVAALQAGDFQALDSVPASDVGVLTHTAGVRVFRQQSFGWQGIAINIGNRNGVGKPYVNVGTPLAESPVLRRAFEEAIDRNAVVRVALGGAATPGCTPIPPLSPVYDAHSTCTSYNPADAKRLVASSGFSNPTVHLLVSNSTISLQLAQVLQAEEAAVGITVVIDPVDNVTLLARLASGAFDTSITGWSGSPAIDRNVYQFVDTAGARNFAGYSNRQVDKLLDEERRATTVKRQKALYDAAFARIHADRPFVFLYHPIAYAAVATRVQGVQLTSDIQLRVAFAGFR